MYEKAALLGESGAEAEAKRLRKYISRLGMEGYRRNMLMSQHVLLLASGIIATIVALG